ncbi:hypothetical protein M231_02667 [Tremella mesenterica]|uniref:Transcription initiation factor TFIID subunit 12 domain-containing protein n=1 Tax=Tremella mesenterica TaxID=5217 RepID=A0A4V1M4D9_TREME|nr:hypothetical protein M231_02667 [Tremella mesenterica]
MSNPQMTTDAILARFPQILTEEEKRLPDDKKSQVLKSKIAIFLRNQQTKQAQAQQQQQHGMQARPVGVGVRPGQSPRIGMMQGVANQTFPAQMVPQSQQGQHQLQQQIQMQQQQQQQQQMNQMSVPQRMPSMSSVSPQHPPQSSPANNAQMLGRSPNPNSVPNRGPTPVGGRPTMGTMGAVQASALIDKFPQLLHMHQTGNMPPDLEKAFRSLLATPEGKAQLERHRAEQANLLVQNHLSNPISQMQHPHPVQTPQNGMDANQAAIAQQHIAVLQQQQKQQQAQLANTNQFAHVLGNNSAYQNLHNPQVAAQLQQQLQLRQLQAMQRGSGQTPQQVATQAAALAHAQAQSRLMQQQQQQAAQSQQQTQGMMMAQQQMMDSPQQFASPHPPNQQTMPDRPQPQGQMQTQHLPTQQTQMGGQPPLSLNPKMRATFQKLMQVPEQQREGLFAQRPELRAMYLAWLQQGQQSAPHMQQHPQTSISTQSPHLGPSTPNGNQSRPPANFSIANNVPNNLHIPINRQRNIIQNQVPQPASESPRPPQLPTVPSAPNPNVVQAQVQAIQRLQSMQGLQVDQAIQNAVRPTPPIGMSSMAALSSQMISPSMFVATMSAQSQARPPMSQVREPNESGIVTDQTGSLLALKSWEPTEEYDAMLREKMNTFRSPMRNNDRGSLGGRMASSRLLGDVVMEKIPEGLQTILDETMSVEGDEEKGEKKRGALEGSGLPGQKKRKVQEMAESVDRGLLVEGDVEMLFLQLADEQADTLCQVSVDLASHRKSSTIDRKDVQLAYEMLSGRIIPGFSSDSIRLDQSRTSRMPPIPSHRATRIKLVADARATWRKERQAERNAAEVT